MPNEVDSYKIGTIRVSITENDKNNKLTVDCNDDNFHSAFTISRYEYENYKRHMNQRIKNAYNQQYNED